LLKHAEPSDDFNSLLVLQLQITAKKMQLFLNLFIFTDTLQVSGGSSAHHWEQVTVHTASGIVKQYCC
jgi:hypothetical protein